MDVLKRLSPQQHNPDALRIVEIDDIKGEGADLLTDGCGYISADLADVIPPTAHGRCVSGPRGPSVMDDDDGGGGGALVMQVRPQ